MYNQELVVTDNSDKCGLIATAFVADAEVVAGICFE